MKRFTILFLMACLFAATGVAKPKVKDISGSIAINGELKKKLSKHSGRYSRHHSPYNPESQNVLSSLRHRNQWNTGNYT